MKHLLRLNAYKVFSCEKNSNHKKCCSHKSAEIWRSIKKIENYYFTSFFLSPVWPFWIMKRMDKQRESDNIVSRLAQWRKDTSGFAFIDCSADGKSAKGKQKSYHCVLINAFCGGSQRTDGMQALEFICCWSIEKCLFVNGKFENFQEFVQRLDLNKILLHRFISIC